MTQIASRSCMCMDSEDFRGKADPGEAWEACGASEGEDDWPWPITLFGVPSVPRG
jgi:hypothetical protein